MSIFTMLESCCVLKRPTTGRDAASGVTQNPFVFINGTDKNPLACSQQEGNAAPEDLYEQRNTFVHASLYFAQNPGCEVNDIAIVTDRNGYVTTYLILGEAQYVGRGRLWVVSCQRIRAPQTNTVN